MQEDHTLPGDNLCCNVNTYVVCVCGMKFCADCYGDGKNGKLGKGHITRIDDDMGWNNKGLCTSLSKVVTGNISDYLTGRPWQLREHEEVVNG